MRWFGVITVTLLLMIPASIPGMATQTSAPSRAKVSKLVVKVKGVKRGRVRITGKRVRKKIRKTSALRLKPGTYRVRARGVKKGKKRFVARPASARVRLKRGRKLVITVKYRKKVKKVRPAKYKPSGEAAAVFRLVNGLRDSGTTCGGRWVKSVRPLVYNQRLEQAAGRHAKDMAAGDFFSHYSSDGSSFLDRVYATGFLGQPGSESLARGLSSPRQVVAAWANDPVDCMAMMDRGFDYIGIGAAARQDARYAEPITYWVSNLGYAK